MLLQLLWADSCFSDSLRIDAHPAPCCAFLLPVSLENPEDDLMLAKLALEWVVAAPSVLVVLQ